MRNNHSVQQKNTPHPERRANEMMTLTVLLIIITLTIFLLPPTAPGMETINEA